MEGYVRDVVSFGEGQLRLTVQHQERLEVASSFRVCSAGSEANVVGVLAQLGWRTAFLSSVAAGRLGDRVLADYRAVGVDTRLVQRPTQGRIAGYFLEPAAPPLSSQVVYDREHTAFGVHRVTDSERNAVATARLLFVSGITLALTSETRAAVRDLVAVARSHGTQVVFDVNYRQHLWDALKARSAYESLVQDVDLLFCSRRDAASVFGIESQSVARAISERLGVPNVVSTSGIRPAQAVIEGADLETDVQPAKEVIDRPGAGDTFIAAFLDGYLAGDPARGLRQAPYASLVALTHFGDLTRIRRSDLDPELGSDITR